MNISDLPNIKADLLDVPSIEKLTPEGDLAHPPRILMRELSTLEAHSKWS